MRKCNFFIKLNKLCFHRKITTTIIVSIIIIIIISIPVHFVVASASASASELHGSTDDEQKSNNFPVAPSEHARP